MTNLASLSPSLARPTGINTLANPRGHVEPQNTLANRLSSHLGLEPGSLNGKRDDYTPEKVAGRILDFIDQRMKSEAAAGADPAKLQEMMGQAREGVEKGFAEARKILDGMGVLKGKVAEDIDATYAKIQEGFRNMESTYGIKAPSTGDTVSVTPRGEGFRAQAETFDMQVTTRDGDRLNISVARASAEWSQKASEGGEESSGRMQIGGWQVDVEGELSDDERTALEGLFKQVQDISSDFYAGDLNGAFDRALQLNMDGSQLASMSLRLTQTSMRQANDAYSSVAQQGGQPAASAMNESLVDYARGLLDALRTADKVSEDATGTLEQLLDGGFSLDERLDQQSLEKARELNSRLLDGMQGMLDKTPAEQA
ncbi:DUF5610 domain-containing protein [Pseudomonas subflava]|uniref:DUF5610 domain-containing protein n=1 Tax=Pseudomonas subflava TaxID=2952933 RepID=UPI0020794EC6|nr:DUF5610 domain-containing protein [Pseudomonas subflava]